MLSILTPAYNEEANLEALHQRIVQTMARVGGEWEWLIVDDHSRDDTFRMVRRLAAVDRRVRGLRLARNSGSHLAITCGLHHVRGDAAVMMAADLQDPPETLNAMLERLRLGANVVWAVRRERPGEKSHAGFAAVYYWIMRHVVGMKTMPARGADFFLIDRLVIDAFRRFPERNVSIFALLTWIGFRQDFIEYDKQPRRAGKSGWTLSRKVALVVDSVTAFSALPLRLASMAGSVLLVASVVVLGAALLFQPSDRALWLLASLVLGLSSVQLLALGIVGEYVWRTFDDARRRPAYVIEAAAGEHLPAGAALSHVE